MIATREQLIGWIAAAISDARSLTPEEQRTLLEVGQTAEKVARGNTLFDGCGCPAVQAGIANESGVAPRRIEQFMLTFDALTSGLAHGDYNTPERNLILVIG